MVDYEIYSKYLKVKKKASEERIDRYYNDIKSFEKYLQRHKEGLKLDDATPQDVSAFIYNLEDHKKGSSIPCVWGLATYFEYIENYSLMAKASELMWDNTPNPLKLYRVEGIEKFSLWKIEQFGVDNVKKLLSEGRTKEQREELALKSALSYETITELVEMAELSRLPNIKQKRMVLYHNCGFTNITTIASTQPEKLITCVSEYIKSTNFDGVPPEPKEAETTIKLACYYEQRVEY